MDLQFSCPYCQQLMTANASLAGSQVQCPMCHQIFMVGSSVAAMPVVQARSTAPAPPQQRPPQAAPKGTASGPRAPMHKPQLPRAATRTRTPAGNEEAKVKAALVAILLGGVGLVTGAIWLVSYFTAKVEKDSTALPESVVKREKAQKEQIEKEKKEEQILLSKNKDATRKFLRAYVCDGDDKVAGELMSVIETIDAEHDALCRDADMNNDPKDVRVFWKERLAKHTSSNIVLRNWLGGRSPGAIVTALFGEERGRERGNTPAFLLAGGYTGNGTGFCISPDGWIVTNEHVAGDAREVDVRGADGKIVVAKVVRTDAKADLALLKIAEKPAAWLSVDPAAMQRGGNVFTVGFPNATVQGVEPKFTDGRISSTAGIRDDADTYQTSVPVGPGNSGGALIDLKSGAVAGVISSKLNSRLDAGNVSYAIKSKVLETMLKSVSGTPQPAAANADGSPAAGETAIIERVTAATYLILIK